MDPYNATVAHRQDVAEGLMILKVRPDGEPLGFLPGQYTVLGLVNAEGKLVKRAYSIASANRAGEDLEFYLTLVHGGALTPLLFELKAGDRVFVAPKATGLFTLNRMAEGTDALLMATGTGLAPYMSMLRSQLACGARQKFVVLQGARYSWELGYRGDLEKLARDCKNFFYLPSITRPREDAQWSGLTGYLQDILFSGQVEAKTGIALDPARLHVFLCGHPGMIATTAEKLAAKGFAKDKGKVSGTLHTEEYW